MTESVAPSSNKSSIPTWRRAVLLAIVIHWVMMGLLAAEIIPQQTNRDGSFFYFHQGGDNRYYYRQANAISRGELLESKYPLGYSFLIVPVLALADELDHDTTAALMAFFWSIVMFPLGFLVFGWIAKRMTQHNWATHLSVLLYALLPAITWVVLLVIWNAYMAEILAVRMTWAQLLSDGPTAFFTLLAVAVFIQTRHADYTWPWIFLLGSILGFLVLIRLSGVLIAVVIAVLFLVERRYVRLVGLTFIALIVFAPQLLYNQHFFGNPLTSGYTVLDDLPPLGLFHIQYLLDALGAIWARLGMLMLIGIVGVVAILGSAMRFLWQQDRIWALLVAGWLVSYLAFYSIYYYSWQGAFLRFLIPALPVVALCGGIVLVQSARKIYQQ